MFALLSVVLVGMLACNCQGKSTLTDIALEVRQLEQALSKLEDTKDATSFADNFPGNYAQSKRELEAAVAAKRNSKTFFDEIEKLQQAKKELATLAINKLLREAKPASQDKPMSKAKKEVYDLMTSIMQNEANDDVEELDSRVCQDEGKDCDSLAAMAGGCDKASMGQKCRKTCGYCLHCEDKTPMCSGKADLCEGPKRIVMKEFCNDTCGYCKTPAPKPCYQSQFSCCWDRETKKNDEVGSNCPICEDSYRATCVEFEPDCLVKNIAGEFMRKFCPISCKLCGVPNISCFDSPGLEDKCALWKDKKWCTRQPEITGPNCKKTCGLCDAIKK